MDVLNELEVILRDNTVVTGAEAMKKFIESEVDNVIEYADTGDFAVDLHTPKGIQGAAELIALHIEASTQLKIDTSSIVEEIHRQLKLSK